jgi:UDP-3-O-[3-hydroxymyristoyl] glucosamine N-acyltransferase
VIAGRARIGAKAWIGASAVVSNAVRVGEGARVRLGAMVIRDVPDGASVSGNFAVDHARTLRRYIEDAGP